MSLTFVVVSGLPASGKSTVGRAVVPLLGLPLFDKDDYLEASFPSGPVTSEDRQRLSREADDQLRRSALDSGSGVLVSWWRRPGFSSRSGTPTDWLTPLGPSAELHCHCPPELAAERFLRRRRHPGHGDDRRQDLEEMVERFRRLADAGPLGVGPVTFVDTSTPMNPRQVVAALLTTP